MSTYLLLLHELGVGAVVDNIASKNGSGQNSVDILSIHILELAVEDEVIALGAESDRGLLAEENEGEDVAKLWKQRALVRDHMR